MKDYMEVRREHKGRATPPLFVLINLNMEYICLKRISITEEHIDLEGPLSVKDY